jgi:hypothetical protein
MGRIASDTVSSKGVLALRVHDPSGYPSQFTTLLLGAHREKHLSMRKASQYPTSPPEAISINWRGRQL